jgi:hypothetical protein
MEEKKLMNNVDFDIADDILTIKVDLTQTNGRSKTGKTLTVASTGGFVKIEDGEAMFSLNVNRYNVRE